MQIPRAVDLNYTDLAVDFGHYNWRFNNFKIIIIIKGLCNEELSIFVQAEGSSAESIAALAKVDTVKQRMEAAYETLQVEIASDLLFLFVCLIRCKI